MAQHRSIGLVGLGFMGAALARRLLDAGYGVVGADVDTGRAAAFARMGGEPAASAAEVARRCPVVILAVYDATQVTRLIQGESSLLDILAGNGEALILCTTTCGPDEIAAVSALVESRRVAFIECPISGTSEQVLTGEGVGLVAGDTGEIGRVRDLLSVLCPRHSVIGGIGAAARAKLAVNLVLQLNRAALAEGLVLAERLGLDTRAFLALLMGSAAASQVMSVKGDKMVTGDFEPQSHIAQTHKDAGLIIETARQAGQRLPLMETNRQLLQMAIDSGGPQRDSSAVIDAIRNCRT